MIEPEYDFWSFVFLCGVIFFIVFGYYISYQGLRDYLGYTYFIHDKGPHPYRMMLILFLVTNLLLGILVTFNELISIDVSNKQITFKKTFGSKKSFSFKDIDGYIITRNSREGKYIYYFVKDKYVVCRYNDLVTTNWEEISKGFAEIGYKKLSCKGFIMLNWLLGIKVKLVN